jgi:hypothetical protein
MEGQIFDEGKGLLPNSLKKCFPAIGTGRPSAVVLPRTGGRERIAGGNAARVAEEPSFRLA